MGQYAHTTSFKCSVTQNSVILATMMNTCTPRAMSKKLNLQGKGCPHNIALEVSRVKVEKHP